MTRRMTVARRHRRAPSGARGAVTLVAVGSAVALLLNGASAVAADNDSVGGTVILSVPAPVETCITVDFDGIIFGSQGGNTLTSPTGSNNIIGHSTPATITNCSTGDETFLANVTPATGATSSWQPYDPFAATDGPTANICTHGLDQFRLSANVTDTEPPSGTFLTTTDRDLNGADVNDPVLTGTTRSVAHEFTMPCEGSSGADAESVTFTMTYTAVLAP